MKHSHIFRARRTLGVAAWLVTAALVLVSSGCGGHSRRAQTPRAYVPPYGGPAWHPLEVQSARFRVLMPIRTVVKTEHDRADDGTPMRVYSAQVEDARMMLSFVASDVDGGIAGDPVELLNGLARRFLEEVDRFDVISSKEITHQGLIGLEVRSRDPDESLELFTRHLVGRHRTFTLIAAVRADAVQSARPMIDYYFGSLAVSPEEGVVPQGSGAMGSGWAYVTPARDDFSVRLPGSPGVADVTLELDGRSIPGREYRVAVPDGSVSFVVRVYRFDERMPERLLEKAEARLLGSGRSVKERVDLQQQGYAGALVVYANGDAAEHTAYVQTMSRLYEFTATNPTSREAELAEARQAFLQSIRIH